MAEIQTTTESKASKNKWRKAIHMDMTPMVDLGFLLITFFIFTSSMTDARGLKLVIPADGDSAKIGDSSVISIVLADNNKIIYYEGNWDDALRNNKIIHTNYSMRNGVGDLIRNKISRLGINRNQLMLLIKPGESSTYRNLVNALDEMMINDLQKYAIVKLTEEEKDYIRR